MQSIAKQALALYGSMVNDLEIGPIETVKCMVSNCLSETETCFENLTCIKTLACIAECDQTQPGCDLNCEVKETRDIKKFTLFSNCIFANGCRD